MTDQDSFDPYKNMLLDDRRRNEEQFKEVFKRFDDINIQLAEIRGQKSAASWFANIITGLAAAAATWFATH